MDPGVITNELHVVDPETGTIHDLGRVGTEARSPVWWQADGGWRAWFDRWLRTGAPAGSARRE
jgi:hypothetical protein